VQVDLRFLSIPGDVCVHPGSFEEPVMAKWKEWARILQQHGTPCIVQIAHPGRMSPAGAGNRPADMPALCPSAVPVKMGESWLDKIALDKLLGAPKAMSLEEIDEAVENFKRAAKVTKEAGFAGIQLHGAHGFLISQFLSPHTNRRTDEYGGSPEKRLKFLKRLVMEIRELCPAPFALGVKLSSGDYMAEGGLQQDEALEQVRWLLTCDMVDFVEISGGNAEGTTSKLHNSIAGQSLQKASEMPKKESTRLREAFFTEFAESVQVLGSEVPIQLSGGFRSRTGMADAIQSGACQMIGLGRSAVLEPTLPRDVLLNPNVPDDAALGMPHMIRGLWLSKVVPAKIVGAGLPIQFFYWNMRRLGEGLAAMPYASLPWIVFSNTVTMLRETLSDVTGLFLGGGRVKTD